MATIYDLLTTDYLKKVAMTGVDLTDDLGTDFPDELWDHCIRTAVSTAELELGITLQDVRSFTTRIDANDYDQSSYFLNPLPEYRPLVSITRLGVRYGAFDAADLPLERAYIANSLYGVIQILPGKQGIIGWTMNGAGAAGLAGRGFTGQPYIPGWIEVEGTYGWAWDGNMDNVPWDYALIDALVILASFLPLDTAGDLIIGAGIAGKSWSFDGLGGSVQTTSSATNSGYGARVIQSRQRYLKHTMLGLKKKYKPLNLFVM